MVDVVQHLLRVATIGRREGLVPVREDERVWVGRRVLQSGEFINVKSPSEISDETHSSDLVELALYSQTEMIQIYTRHVSICAAVALHTTTHQDRSGRS